MILDWADSLAAWFVVLVEGQLVPISDKVVAILEEEFYRNVGVVRRDTPCPSRARFTPGYAPPTTSCQWPRAEEIDFDPYAEFIPNNYEDNPNKSRQRNWENVPLLEVALTGGKGVLTQWVHSFYPLGTWWVLYKVPTQEPNGYFLSETPEFFHNSLSNAPITNLSHSLKVLP
ncbi:hypothetical protein BJ322DRAFT_1023449 [Thelephora terrestris]|uniref:Uncharacterized protein n=1 Tax=Thelephora terrestris TaxID=56493 RepID=A0A9P6L383_9AGAM|nr:hypothetical protein BJ322DRAFT_1023449 [Thelephora terrestris]